MQNKSNNADFDPTVTFPKLDNQLSKPRYCIPDLVKIARDLDPDSYAEFRRTKATEMGLEASHIKSRKDSQNISTAEDS